MATNQTKTNPVQEAQQRLRLLQARQAHFRERLADLLEAAAKVDPADEQAPARLSGFFAERGGIEQALAALTRPLEAARLGLVKATEADRQAKLAAAQEALQQATLSVARLTGELQDALDDYLSALRTCTAQGGRLSGDVPAGLINVIGTSMAFWRSWRPELLGFPPKPTAHQERTSEARHELLRMIECEESARKAGAPKEVIGLYEAGQTIAHARLAELAVAEKGE